MIPRDPRIERFLDSLKTEGRSSPEGLHWNEFYEFLCTKRLPNRNSPPTPLILGASGEPNLAKHQRLSEQLQWALENGCVEEALRHLQSIPPEKRNSSPLDRWQQHSYPF